MPVQKARGATKHTHITITNEIAFIYSWNMKKIIQG